MKRKLVALWALMCAISMFAFFFSVLSQNGFEGLSCLCVVILLFWVAPILERYYPEPPEGK